VELAGKKWFVGGSEAERERETEREAEGVRACYLAAFPVSLSVSVSEPARNERYVQPFTEEEK